MAAGVAADYAATTGVRRCTLAALRRWRRSLWRSRLPSLAHAHALSRHAPRAQEAWSSLAASHRYVSTARAIGTWCRHHQRGRRLQAAFERYVALTWPSPWRYSLMRIFLGRLSLAAALRRPTLAQLPALRSAGRLAADDLTWAAVAQPSLLRGVERWRRWSRLGVRVQAALAAKAAAWVRRRFADWVVAWVDSTLVRAVTSAPRALAEHRSCAAAVQRWVCLCATAAMASTRRAAQEKLRRRRAWRRWGTRVQGAVVGALGALIGAAACRASALRLAMVFWSSACEHLAVRAQAVHILHSSGHGWPAARLARRFFRRARLATLASVLEAAACLRSERSCRRRAWQRLRISSAERAWEAVVASRRLHRSLGRAWQRWRLTSSPSAPLALAAAHLWPAPLAPAMTPAWVGARAALLFRLVGRAFAALVCEAERKRAEAAEASVRERHSLCAALVTWRAHSAAGSERMADDFGRERTADGVRACRALHRW